MILSIIKNKWEYEIKKRVGEGLQGYGYELTIFKNDNICYKWGGFGSESIAEAYARDYFLLMEFNIERED